jgi:hypothetical protein
MSAYIISMDTIKTICQGALGSMTFGAYHMFVTTEMMKINNENERRERLKLEKEIDELKKQLNKKTTWF